MSQRCLISRSSVARIIKKDLGLKFVRRGYTFKLTAQVKERRLLRCRQLLNKFRTQRQIQKIWFTDEKIFTLTVPKNSQNDRLCIRRDLRKSDIALDRMHREREKFSSYVMVSAGISRNFKVNLIFINQGVRLDSQGYCRNVLDRMLPEIEDIMPDFTFMQVSTNNNMGMLIMTRGNSFRMEQGAIQVSTR